MNPIAGMGGAVGLKGTDGERVQHAYELGARPQSARRAGVAMQELNALAKGIHWLTVAGEMGANLLTDVAFAYDIVYAPHGEPSGDDTQRAVAAMLEQGIDLLLFAGGDGTARDVLVAAHDQVPVLGIPAGVKMHSAVFAFTPRGAGQAARRFLEAGAASRFLAPREVMDRELSADGEPAASPSLYGYLQTLQMPSLVQSAKAVVSGAGDAALAGALQRLSQELSTYEAVVLGPGATLLSLKRLLGMPGTLLGVDIAIRGGQDVKDATEVDVWQAVQGDSVCLVVGVIGGQGFLFGRGNQQFSARVLRASRRHDLRVLASMEKLVALADFTLRVDTGDADVDAMLEGHLPVITGARRSLVCRIASGS